MARVLRIILTKNVTDRVKLLQRTLLLEVLRVFSLVLSGITAVLVCVVVFKYAGDMGLGPAQIVRIIPYAVPSMLPFTIPATLLLTVCVVYGRVSGDLELTAAKAAGVNPLSLIIPTIFLSVCLSGAAFVLTDRVIPWAFHKITIVGVEAIEDIFLSQLRSGGKFHHPSSALDIVVHRVEGKRLIRPIFRYPGEDGRSVVMQAREAQFHFDVANQQMFVDVDAGHAEFSDGTSFDILCPQRIPLPWLDTLQKPSTHETSLNDIRTELADHRARETVNAAKHDLLTAMSLSAGDFDQFADVVARSGRSDRSRQRRVNKLKTERASRYALACSCLFFSLLGSPFALLRGQTQFLTSFLYCFLPIVGAYYPLMLGIMSQAKSGAIDPNVAVWAGNFGLLLAAVVAIRKLCRH